MKAHFKILTLVAFFAIGCSPSYVAPSAYDDDVYYKPGDTPQVVKLVEQTTHKPVVESSVKSVYKPKKQENIPDNRDFSAIQKRYSEIAKTNTLAEGDVVTVPNDTLCEEETGYYISGFNGSRYDEEEAARLRRMYPDGFGYYNNTGNSFAMFIAGDPDWNVYVDGDRVWWTPSWTNHRFYNSYTFSPMRYGSYFNYGYGYNSWDWDWDFGFGFNPWYGRFGFGWNSFYPYYPYYPYHPYAYYPFHYYGFNNYYRGRYISNRNYHRITDRYSDRRATSSRALGNTMRRSNYNAGKSATTVTTPARRSRFDNDARRQRAAMRYSSRFNRNNTSRAMPNSRSSYNRRGVATHVKTTRAINSRRRSNYSTTRTVVPRSYNRTRTINRPVYNSSTRSNYSARPVRRSTYSKVKRTSPSKSVYKRTSQSSNSNRKTYRRSSSSSRRSSYTPSRSTRSSGSEIRRSSESSRSTGGSTRSGRRSRR